MIYILTIFVFAYIIWRAKRLIWVADRRIYFDPSIFFLLSFVLLSFIPQALIYSLETFETVYTTFSREQTGTTMAATCLFGFFWTTTATMFSPPRAATTAVYQRAVLAGRVPLIALASSLILAILGIGLHLFLFRDTGSISGQILRALFTGNLFELYNSYNGIRYATTKQLFLESGVRGMGTVTTMMEYLVFGATALVFHVSKTWPRTSANLACGFLSICSLFVSLATGARTKAAYCVVFITVLVMLAFQKNQLKIALQGFFLLFAAIITFTALTPKTGEISPFEAVFNRLAGNAVNDAVIVEVQSENGFGFENPFFGSEDTPALDRQLTFYFTGNPNLIWYETPTCIARYFVQAGFFGVAVNAVILGFLCRFTSFWLRREQDPMVLLPMFPLICVINLQLPLTGWLIPSLLLSSSVLLLLLKGFSLIGGSGPRRQQGIPMVRTECPAS